MEFRSTFDLEDFLAYLLPGFLMLGVLIFDYRDWFAGLYQGLPPGTSEFFSAFLLIALLVTVSVVLGQIFSLVSRFVWRTLTNLLLGDPEEAIFSAKHHYFTPTLNQLIARQFARVFGASMTEEGIRDAVPRLIRSYVFTRSQNAAVSRERIVRSRSICSNLVSPVLIIAFLGPFNMNWCVRAALVLTALLLLIKQRDLDVRETKEIYLTFAAITGASHLDSPAASAS